MIPKLRICLMALVVLVTSILGEPPVVRVAPVSPVDGGSSELAWPSSGCADRSSSREGVEPLDMPQRRSNARNPIWYPSSAAHPAATATVQGRDPAHMRISI